MTDSSKYWRKEKMSNHISDVLNLIVDIVNGLRRIDKTCSSNSISKTVGSSSIVITYDNVYITKEDTNSQKTITHDIYFCIDDEMEDLIEYYSNVDEYLVNKDIVNSGICDLSPIERTLAYGRLNFLENLDIDGLKLIKQVIIENEKK